MLLSLPASLKIRGGRHKWPLYELARRYVPAAVLDRPKRGFTPPMGQWLSQHGQRLAQVFAEAGAANRGLYSHQWWNYLTAGRYDPACTMPTFYSLMLALWTQHYGRYVSQWPGAAPAPAPARQPAAADRTSPWQQALRYDDQPTLARARWFCQALNNFPAGARVRLVGDEHGWYARLARSSGLTVLDDAAADSAACDGVVVLGCPSAARAEVEAPRWAALAPGKILMLVASYPAAEQAQVQALLTTLDGRFKCQGFQGVVLGPEQGCLLARFVLPETETAQRIAG